MVDFLIKSGLADVTGYYSSFWLLLRTYSSEIMVCYAAACTKESVSDKFSVIFKRFLF